MGNPEEVDDLKYVTKEELKAMMDPRLVLALVVLVLLVVLLVVVVVVVVALLVLRPSPVTHPSLTRHSPARAFSGRHGSV